MVHLNYAINIWLFLNNKGSHTTSRHKRRDDKEKRYGSHMAGWGRGARSVWSSRARRRGLRGHQGKESTQLLLSSIRPSSTEPSVCQDKQMRRHMLERLLENYWGSFSSRTRWKKVCNPVVFIPPHTVIFPFFTFIWARRSASITSW